MILLILEILHRAQAAHHDVCPLPPHIVGQQAGGHIHAHIRHMCRRRAEKIDALLQRETSLLGDIVENADNELIEHGRCALHNINVPRRHGIETPGKNRPSHPCSSSA